MKRTYSQTIHLTPKDLEEILTEYFGLSALPPKINFKVEQEYLGQGPAEHAVHRFAGVDLVTSAVTDLGRIPSAR